MVPVRGNTRWNARSQDQHDTREVGNAESRHYLGGESPVDDCFVAGAAADAVLAVLIQADAVNVHSRHEEGPSPVRHGQRHCLDPVVAAWLHSRRPF